MKTIIKLLIFLLAGIGAISCDKKEPTKEVVRPVKAMQLGAFSGFSERSFPGRAKATEEVNLSFDVGGRLIERPVNIGDTVAEGQLIARLDPRDFQAKLKAARAELQKNRQNFSRAKELIKKDFISKAQYDLLEASVKISEANVALAGKALSDSVIKAPFAGRIANVFVENFQSVIPKQKIARLLDTSRIEMVIDIPESLISDAPYVKNIRVRFDAQPQQEIPATIKEVSNEASANTRTYPVTLIMEQSDEFEILPGMAGHAHGETHHPDQSSAKQGFEIPLSATFSPDATGTTYVWVIDRKNETVNRRKVTTEALSQYGINVVKGLQTGEWIATAGVHHLQEGQKVTILPEPGEQR